MISPWGILANGLWIAGLAVLLAGASWAHWRAGMERPRWRTMLKQAGIRRALNVGAGLFCAGMSATGRRWWEWVLWGLLALGFSLQAVLGDWRKTS